MYSFITVKCPVWLMMSLTILETSGRRKGKGHRGAGNGHRFELRQKWMKVLIFSFHPPVLEDVKIKRV